MDAEGDFVVVWSARVLATTKASLCQRFFPVPSGIAFASGDGTRDSVLSDFSSGSLASVKNAVLDGLVFTPFKGFNGLGTVTIETADLGSSELRRPTEPMSTRSISTLEQAMLR